MLFTQATPIEESPGGLVWQTQEPLIISNGAAESRWPRYRERVRPAGGQSCCSLPLTTARRRLGTLAFVCKQPYAYAAAALSFLQRVANQARHLPATRQRWNQQSVTSAQLAAEYGFTDVEGSRPDVWRYHQAVETGDQDANPSGYR